MSRFELSNGHAHVLVRHDDPARAKIAAERAIKAINDTLDPPREPEDDRSS